MSRLRARTVPRTVAMLVPLLLLSPGARADPKDDCIRAHTGGQVAREQNRLLAAQAALVECARVCPIAVQRECVQWLDEVTASQPTVVFEARDSERREITVVTVYVDGNKLVDKVTGDAVAVDPGERTFRFETAGSPPVEEKHVVRQGEKNRKIAVVFAGPSAHPPAARVPDGTSAAAPPPAPKAPMPVAAYVLGGVGLLGMGAFTVFAVLGRNKQSDLEVCNPGCDHAEIDAMYRDYLVADISLAVGGAALVGAAAVAIWHATRPAPVRSAWVRVGRAPGAGITFGAAF